MTAAITPPAFVADGLCGQADPEAFFPERGTSAREAKLICFVCPVRVMCLNWALDTNERFGVWGGLTERERRQLRHQTAA